MCISKKQKKKKKNSTIKITSTHLVSINKTKTITNDALMFMTKTSNRLQKPFKTFIHSSKSAIIAWFQPCTTKKPIYSSVFFETLLYVAYYFWNFRMMVKKKLLARTSTFDIKKKGVNIATIKTLSNYQSLIIIIVLKIW